MICVQRAVTPAMSAVEHWLALRSAVWSRMHSAHWASELRAPAQSVTTSLMQFSSVELKGAFWQTPSKRKAMERGGTGNRCISTGSRVKTVAEVYAATPVLPAHGLAASAVVAHVGVLAAGYMVCGDVER